MRLLLATFVILAANITAISYSQNIVSNYSFRRYTIEDGLPSYTLESVYQDSDGYIWVGSTEGIAKYDGFTFQRFFEGKFCNIIRISESHNNQIVAHGMKLFSVNMKNDKTEIISLPKDYYSHYNNHKNLHADFAILQQSTSSKKQLFEIKNGVFRLVLTHPLLDKLDGITARPFIDEQQKEIYLPMEGGISILNFKGEILNEFLNYYALNFCKYNNEIWFVDYNGLYKFSDNKVIKMAEHTINKMTPNVSLCADNEGGFLYCDDKNVFCYSNGKVEIIFSGVNQIRDIALDDEGNLWIATYQGLYNLFRRHFKNYFIENSNDIIRGVIEDNEGNIIAGTKEGCIFKINGLCSKKISYPPNEYGNFFGSYFAKHGESIMLAGAGKILKMGPNKLSWIKDLPIQNYNFISALPDGTFAGIGQEALQFFDIDGKLIKTINSDTLKQAIYSQVITDKKGNLWCGGAKGITIITKSEIKYLHADTLRPCLVINSDNNNDIWFAVENRLYKVVGDKIMHKYSFSSSIQDILFTKNNKYIIISVLNGVYICDYSFKNLILYDYLNGFTGQEPMRSKMIETIDGSIWMPSVTCLVNFLPEKLVIEQPKPKLYIRSISISNDNILWRSCLLNKNIILNHGENNLNIKYIGLSYSQSKNIRYQYRLQNFQDKWSAPTEDREVTFNNLAPGNYIFEIKASGNMFNTQTDIVRIEFTIKPAFWQTIWFILASILIMLSAVTFFTYKYFLKKNEKKILAINRQKQINELLLQSTRLKSIPHFNSNVLAGIEYYLMNHSKEEANSILSVYSKFTNQTLRDVDKPDRTLREEIEYVAMYLNLEKFRFNDKFEYFIKIGSNVNQNIKVPNMVLHTYCENAIKHGIRNLKTKNGSLTIAVKRKENGIEICVEDNGVGRAYTNAIQRERKGYGLDILNKQIDLYNEENINKIYQQIIDKQDSNKNSEGTIFVIYIPDNYKYY